MKRWKRNRGGNNDTIQGGDGVIVTFNLKGYPDASAEA